MPSTSKTNPSRPRSRTDLPTPEHTDTDNIVADQDVSTKASRKKNKNAATKQSSNTEGRDGLELAKDGSTSPKPQSILGQLPYVFPRRDERNPDLLPELNTTEKVFDEHTPPQETWITAAQPQQRQPPPPNPVSAMNHSSSPPTSIPYEGGFTSTRSPPVSPPQRKVRPISFAGPMPPPSAYSRSSMSTSPYGHPTNTYGSPQNLPHMPQPHFYNPQDVALGPASHPRQAQQNFVKFGNLPASASNQQSAVLAGYGDQLEVMTYGGEKMEHIGRLCSIGGTIVDAVLLTWNDGADPYRKLRPLVAITSYGSANENTVTTGAAGPTITSVSIYSLSEQVFITELLRVPDSGMTVLAGVYPDQRDRSAARLRIQASGNFVVISSADSGEVFAFTARQSSSGPQFQCMAKFWTTIQPRAQRRDSSHTRAGDADVSPADLNRGPDDSEQAIISLSGRWLAYCPASSPSRPSVRAVLGEDVISNKTTTISTGTAPSKPSLNCEVESPDVETLFGKVARGVAQELLKGSKWLGEKGMQTFQSYWRKDATSPSPPTTNSYTSPVYQPTAIGNFPPTHADMTSPSSKEPELVTIVDLKVLQAKEGKKQAEASIAMTTFQPPGGCSFVSFTPDGLRLLTASRKGDVQYIWDLLQLRYSRSFILNEIEPTSSGPRVRQIAKFTRLSPSSVVDVAWEAPNGDRFAVLTLNRTIHMYDIPSNALKWPPPRTIKNKAMSTSDTKSPVQTDQSEASGFIASAMNLAGKTQPMLANLRGRAPSISGGGFSNIGASGFGIASATGVRSGKAVAAGLSKSLGAATDTVAQIRHAGQSKLHLRIVPIAGKLSWHWRERKPVLSVLDVNGIRNYYVRKTNPRDSRQVDIVSVFDARKAVGIKLPSSLGNLEQPKSTHEPHQQEEADQAITGFWKPDRAAPNTGLSAPLGFAEIESNAPYQPFHSDSRVTISVFSGREEMAESQLPTASLMLQPVAAKKLVSSQEQWVFGCDIPTTRLNIGSSDASKAEKQVESVIYRETTKSPLVGDDGMEQIVSTTRRRKIKTNETQLGVEEGTVQEGFFEDDCDVLDFATDRV